MRRRWAALWLVFLAAGFPAAASDGPPVSQIAARITLGGRELITGSSLELRVYEAGRPVLRLPLVHGESWAPYSTHLVPLKLPGPLEPRNVLRFGLGYGSAIAAADELEIASAEVELPGETPPRRLLEATLSGVVRRQGELDTEERDLAAIACRTDADCDDHRLCNGVERCAPRSSGADARGCVKGTPVVCPVNQVCGETSGCRGIETPNKR